MDAHAEEGTVPAGKVHQLSSGKWYVRCKWCLQEARFEAHLTEEQAYGMLHAWRLSVPGKQYSQRNWSCTSCAKWYANSDDGDNGEETAATTTTTATSGSVSQGVQQLKAEVVELKAEIERLEAEVAELKFGRRRRPTGTWRPRLHMMRASRS